MTKDEQLRRRIIELVHGCEYEEALWKEGYEDGALIQVGDIKKIVVNEEYTHFLPNGSSGTGYNMSPDESTDIEHGELLGLPITLARLLKALENALCFGTVEFDGAMVIESESGDTYKVYWTLTNPDGSECTLEDQTQETRDTLHQLLCEQGE